MHEQEETVHEHERAVRDHECVDPWASELQPLEGGYSGETFLVAGGDEEVVVRIYARDPSRALIDASLLTLMRGLLPVPEVIEVQPAYADKPAVLVTARMPGRRLDEVLPRLDEGQLVTVGQHLGRALAILSGVPQLRFGMFEDEDLRVSRAGTQLFDLQRSAQRFRDDGRLAAWAQADWENLVYLLDEAEGIVVGTGREATRHVLVHSDFNPKNLLVDPVSLKVTGVLDWEFAHAGSPYADLGNVTRFERHPAFVESVVSAFLAEAPPLDLDALRLGRAVDLWALVELAGRPGRNAVQELATTLLLAQARTQDLHAWPWPTPRVDPAPLAP